MWVLLLILTFFGVHWLGEEVRQGCVGGTVAGRLLPKFRGVFGGWRWAIEALLPSIPEGMDARSIPLKY
jgi:hypothetical protein